MKNDPKTKIHELIELVGSNIENVAEYKNQMCEYIEGGRFREAVTPLAEILRLEVAQYKKRELEKIEEKAKEQLYLAHYTSVETVFSIIENKDKEMDGLRLYDAFYLNDPSEGEYLKAKLEENYGWLKNAEDTEAFICSFVGREEGCEDRLMYWQSYGKRGLGCSILLSEYFPTAGTFCPVLYGQEEADKVKRTFRGYLELGDKLIHECAKNEEEKGVAVEFWKAFDEIKFMYKDSSYADEREYRMIKTPKEDGEIKYDLRSEGPYLRQYIADKRLGANKILTSGSKITIGPAVRRANHLCENLKKFAKMRGIAGPSFSTSRIPYQKFW